MNIGAYKLISNLRRNCHRFERSLQIFVFVTRNNCNITSLASHTCILVFLEGFIQCQRTLALIRVCAIPLLC